MTSIQDQIRQEGNNLRFGFQLTAGETVDFVTQQLAG